MPRRKLYFDVFVASPGTGAIFACTQPLARPTWAAQYSRERTHSYLDSLPALTGSAPFSMRARNETSAWFVRTTACGALLGQQAMVGTFFVGWVSQTVTGTKLPFLTVGGVVAAKAGQSSVFTRDFAIRLQRLNNITGDIKGMIYVQRQHSVEV